MGIVGPAPYRAAVRNLAVLNGVVKQRGNDQIEVLAVRRFGDQGRNLKQMVDVRLLRGTLAPLVDMPSRRGIGRLQNRDPAFHCAASSRISQLRTVPAQVDRNTT
jgi:hypothetical protein